MRDVLAKGMIDWRSGFRPGGQIEIDIRYHNGTWERVEFSATEKEWEEARALEHDLLDEMYDQQRAVERGRGILV